MMYLEPPVLPERGIFSFKSRGAVMNVEWTLYLILGVLLYFVFAMKARTEALIVQSMTMMGNQWVRQKCLTFFLFL